MEILIKVIFWIHLVALGMGGAALFALPLVGSKIANATAESKPPLKSIGNALAIIGQTAFVLLLITGPLMVWLKFGGVGGFTFWFWIKMVLVATLLGVVIYASIIHAKMEKGDVAAAKWERILDVAGIVVFVGIVFCAVFAFD